MLQPAGAVPMHYSSDDGTQKLTTAAAAAADLSGACHGSCPPVLSTQQHSGQVPAVPVIQVVGQAAVG